MRLFDLLEAKKKRRIAFHNSDEYAYFSKNKSKLKDFTTFPYLQKNRLSDFDIIRANILLQGLENKKNIEAEVENLSKHFDEGKKVTHEKYILTLRERTVGAPYYQEGSIKIFIPFFSKALNSIYTREPEKLLKEPFKGLRETFTGSLIDPFDTYGANLYNSSFTRLIKVGEKDDEYAFFHYDTNTIYIINEQGRLDVSIFLFDKYIKLPNYNNMLERISPVITQYFNNDREEFIKALYTSKFISRRMVGLIRRKTRK